MLPACFDCNWYRPYIHPLIAWTPSHRPRLASRTLCPQSPRAQPQPGAASRMGLDSHRVADNGDGRSARSRRYRTESHDWDTQPDPTHDSPPHHRAGKVHSSRRRTSLRRAGSSSRSLDVPESVTMPPPSPLARSSTDVYRRPRNWMAYDDGRESVTGRRRSRRDASPSYDRREYPSADHSAYSSASGLAYGDADRDHIEVVEEAEDEVATRRGGRQSSRDDYMSSSAGTRYRRRRRRLSDAEEIEVLRPSHLLDDDDASPARESSRTADFSGSSRHGRRQIQNVIEDSRPPVSSQRFVGLGFLEYATLTTSP